MLWRKKKREPPDELGPERPSASGARVSDADRALDAVASVLRLYGKFAFDTDGADAAEIASRCEDWATRILVGDARGGDSKREAPARLARDWPGLSRFVRDQRRSESEYVVRSLGSLREAVLCFAGCLTNAVGEDRESDDAVSAQLAALSLAIERGDAATICCDAKVVVESVRASIAGRRKREAEQVWALGERLRELRDQLGEARRQAEQDALTQLSNRAAFDVYLEHLASLGLLLGESPWLLLVDLDHFKVINDTHGHPAGDEVLRQVSHCLSRTFLRKQDFVCRYGGEEFAALLFDTTEEQVRVLADRLMRNVRELVVAHGESQLTVTLSIGLSSLGPGEKAASWLSRADAALYRAKAAGRDRCELAAAYASLSAPPKS